MSEPSTTTSGAAGNGGAGGRGWRHAPTRLLEWACIIMMSVMVLDVMAGVIWRFIIREPLRWTDELATFLLIWVSMLGAALAHREAAHLGVVWLVERLDAGVAVIVARFIHVLIICFAGVVMLYGGILLLQDRFSSGQLMPALGWNKAWMYMAVPVASLFIIGYSVRELLWPTPLVPSIPEAEIPPPPERSGPASARGAD